MKPDNEQDARKKVHDMIKSIKFANLVTQDEDNRLWSRPMGTTKSENASEIWFFTQADSPKVDHIQRNANICLSYAEPESQSYVSLTGTATIVREQAQIDALWNEALRAWFPKGKQDPNIALIRVSVEAAEYWDNPSASFVIAFGYMKARLTGEQADLGDNRKVRFG